MKYIRTDIKIKCDFCGANNTVILSVVNSEVEPDSITQCRVCGNAIAYEVKIQYKRKSMLKLLQEINNEDDLCNMM
jgi:uncharacterized Zn finger protein